ncbi:hypothetical protein DUI87_01299 [Hirundo rustica rustica]|uniref:Integrase catalytic domain-containing protein n=1 Tax=Hirundo rustica rustica TaxID=333673 RepID=A0A3M0L4G4_HIRRU|nr:hypothetical protein DUI87_01299 [Hirundo rustica rustica]
MFKMLAFENANPKTKSILATLPQGGEVANVIELTLRAEQDKKWPEQRVGSPRCDTNGRPNAIKQLPPPATRGSLGIDLAAAVDVTLIDSRVQRIPTGVTGPIYDKNSALGALLLGRSSTGLAGLIVLPGVIDADYTGEIKVVAYALHPPMTIKKGTCIAQLVLYTKEAVKSDVFDLPHKEGPKVLGPLHLDHNGYRVNGLSQQRKKRKKKIMDRQVLAETAGAEPSDTQSEAEATDDTQSEAEPTDTKSEAQSTGTRSGDTIESFCLKDLCGLRRDYTRRPNESIISWLAHLWDAAGKATMLDGTEARHLGSLSHDPVIDQEMMREAHSCSLREWVLKSVAQRYLCADNLYMQQTQWKTIEQGIQRLREMAVAEIVFSDDLNTRNPDLVPCTPVMWGKLVQLRPEEYPSALAIMKRDDTERRLCLIWRRSSDHMQMPCMVQHMQNRSSGNTDQRLTAIFRRSHLNAAASVGEFSFQPLSVPPLISPPGRHPKVPVQAPIEVHRRQYRTTRDAVIPTHKMICELETQGVVSKTHSPFNNPIWPVRKSDSKWRLTVDYRALNRVTPPLSTAVPDMLELQYELESKAAKWPQFAFTWRGVQYTWNRLPQGWKHRPTICHGLIQAALEKGEALEHLQYINDIIVWGNTAMEVFEKGEIIQILLKAGFAIKKSKVKGPAREIQFLVVKWQDGRRQIPTEVINKITAMSPPTNRKETQSFLGAIGFWRMHIPEYSQIVSPLYLVTRKKNDFHWGPEQQQAFAQIKQEIAHVVALGPVRTGPEVKNMLYSAAGNHSHLGRDATYKWARDRGVDRTTDSISQVIHDCETCAAIKQAKQVKPLWYGGRWSNYKYGEAWQIDYITLPQTRQGKHYVLTMVEATTGWLETYPVPHATARNTILGLEKQVLWRHGTPERIESDNGTHFKNSLINNWAREHGIEWLYHIPYHAPASEKVERYNGLLKTTLKALGGGSFKNWEQHLAKATWLVNTRGSTNRAGPAQSESLHTVDGEKVPVVHVRGLLGKRVWINSASSTEDPIRGIVFAQGPGCTWWVMQEDGTTRCVPQGDLIVG